MLKKQKKHQGPRRFQRGVHHVARLSPNYTLAKRPLMTHTPTEGIDSFATTTRCGRFSVLARGQMILSAVRQPSSAQIFGFFSARKLLMRLENKDGSGDNSLTLQVRFRLGLLGTRGGQRRTQAPRSAAIMKPENG